MTLDKMKTLFLDSELPSKSFIATLEELKSDYSDRGVGLVEVASSFRFQANLTSLSGYSAYGNNARRVIRAFETLALIAYKQPLTRSEIEEVRGGC